MPDENKVENTDKYLYKCPLCLKLFYAYGESYIYKRMDGKKTVRLCSYRCTQEFDKTHVRKRHGW